MRPTVRPNNAPTTYMRQRKELVEHTIVGMNIPAGIFIPNVTIVLYQRERKEKLQ